MTSKTFFTGTENLAGHTTDGSKPLQEIYAAEAAAKPAATVYPGFTPAYEGDKPDTDTSSMRGYSSYAAPKNNGI